MRRRRRAGRYCARRCRGHSCSASWLSSHPPSWRWKRARRRTSGDGRSAVSGTTCGSFHRFTSSRLCVARRTTPLMPKRSPRRPQGQRCALALKTEEQQARSMIFRTRDLLVRQRTQLVNALRGHLADHGIVAAHGLAKLKVLSTAMQDTGSLHPLVRELGQRYLHHIARLDVEIAELDNRLRRPSKDDEPP